MKLMVICAVFALPGCVSVNEKIAQAPTKTSYELCEWMVTATMADSSLRAAWARELQRRGENCQQYMPMIASKAQADAQTQAAMNNLRNSLNQQNRPMQPAFGTSNLLYQSTAGNVRLCTYDKGGQKYTLQQPNLAPCPVSF